MSQASSAVKSERETFGFRRQRAGFILGGIALLAALTSCSGQSGVGVIRQQIGELRLNATGTIGDGVDDIRYVVEKSKVAEYMENESLAPASFDLGRVAIYDDTITFTVFGMSSNGRVGCEIVYGDQSVSNEASGDHPVAKCVARINPAE